jgi:hypothetical protein
MGSCKKKYYRFIGMAVFFMAVGTVYLIAGDDPTTHPHPLPLSNIRPNHPRIWFNSDNVDILRLRWNDPAFVDIVNKYEGTGDALSLALEGLATNNASKCSQAAESVDFGYRPQGDAGAGYVDPISLVFDWCYEHLSTAEKADLISKIEVLRNEHLNNAVSGVRHRFVWHETFLASSFAYIANVLAIEGEPGVSSELQMAQNVLQNLQELGDEVRGDGGFRSYLYQGNFQTLPFLMWSYATDTDFAATSNYTKNLTKWAVRKVSPTRVGFSMGPADDAAFELGYQKYTLSAGGFYLLASHFDDPVAQWLGDRLVNEFGQKRHWQTQGPSFISLVHYNPVKTALSPGSAGMPLTALFDKIGMVHSRSSWGVGADIIDAWFYNGPVAGHFGEGQNHFTIWRGDDPLIMRGGNYLSSPSVYQDHYFRQTVSTNSVLFSPTGSRNPDHDGGQSSVYTDPARNAQEYPAGERLGSWPGQHRYRGKIAFFTDTDNYTIVSGETENIYNPSHVHSYIRDYVHLKPDVFLIRDRFYTTNVSAVRSLIHSRRKPVYGGPTTVVQGSKDAGIIKSIGDHFVVKNGSSQADVQILWPANPRLRFVGGHGYESYADRYNSDPYTDCGEWLKTHWELAPRAALIAGQWRTEIKVDPLQAEGNLILAIHASRKNPAERPVYSVQRAGPDFFVTVDYDRRIRVEFPEDDVPRVFVLTLRPNSGRRLVPSDTTSSDRRLGTQNKSSDDQERTSNSIDIEDPRRCGSRHLPSCNCLNPSVEAERLE